MRRSAFGLAFGLVALACGGPSAPSAPRGTPANEAPRPAAAASEPDADVVVEPPGTAARGQETWARVTVTPTAPWHLNVDYPVKLELEPTEGVRLSVASQEREHAQRYDDEALVFAIPLTVDTCGDKTITGEIDFAVCADAACAPLREPVRLAIAVC